MGMFDGILGGVIGAEMVSIASGIIEKNGGIQGLVQQFEQHGMGDTVKSWIGQGENQAISPEEVQKVLGSNQIEQLAEKFGVPVDQVTSLVAKFLPQAVDKMTPNGEIPAESQTAAA